MTTELFTSEGKPFAVLTETNDGMIITQRWNYAPGAREYEGAPLGGRSANVRLTDEARIAGDFDALLKAHVTLCAEPGMRDAGVGDIALYRAELAKHKGHLVFGANNYPPRG